MTHETTYSELKKAGFHYESFAEDQELIEASDDKKFRVEINADEKQIIVETLTELNNYEPIDEYRDDEYLRVLKELEEILPIFCIWHRDGSLTSTPAFIGTQKEVIKEWERNYAGNTASLNYMISTPSNREGHYVITESDEIEERKGWY